MNENDAAEPAAPAPVMTLARIGEEVKRWCHANLRSIHYASLVVQHLDGSSGTTICIVPPPDRPDVLEMRDLRKLGVMLDDARLGHIVSGFGLKLSDDHEEASARVTFTVAGEVVGELAFPSVAPGD